MGTNGVPGLCYAEMEHGTDGSKQIRMIRACRNEKEKKNDNERRRMERAARNEVEHNNNNQRGDRNRRSRAVSWPFSSVPAANQRPNVKLCTL